MLAIALAGAVAIVLATAAVRSVGIDLSSVAEIDREEARSLAEYAVIGAVRSLESQAIGGYGSSSSWQAALEDLIAASDIGAGRGVEVEISVGPLESDGSFTIHARAQVGSGEQTARALVRPELPTDFVWFSESESVDPGVLASPRSRCVLPHGHHRRDQSCLSNRLGPGVIVGTVRSNDGLELAPSTQLGGRVLTSFLGEDASGKLGPVLREPLMAPEPAGAFAVLHRSEISLPRDIGASRTGGSVTCRFRGPTLIRFDGPRIRVTSPRSAPRTDEGTEDSPEIGCMGTPLEHLGEVAVIDLPAEAIIEVVRDTSATCVDHPLGLHVRQDRDRDWWCDGGDAFVWGRYRGARTVLAQDNIQVVWDLEPGDVSGPVMPGAEDLLGLVAGDSIVLRRLIDDSQPFTKIYGANAPFAGASIPPFGSYPFDAPHAEPSTWEEPTIVAALVALRGSVGVQNPLWGERHGGSLTVVGSVAGRFAGALNWERRSTTGDLLGQMGYEIDLRYDGRFESRPPPGMPVLVGGGLRVLALDVG